MLPLCAHNLMPAVYTAFYLQHAAVLFRPNGTRSLHVGLGVGTAVKGMQRMGVAAGARLQGNPAQGNAAPGNAAPGNAGRGSAAQAGYSAGG